MTAFEWLSLGAAYGVGGVQCLLIWYGLRMMRESGERRDRQLDLMAEAMREQSAGIRALLERTTPQNP